MTAMRAMTVKAAIVAALVAGAGIFAFSKARQDSHEIDPEVIAQGGELYRAHCAACHGENLEGQPDWQNRRADGRLPAPPHDASGHSWHHPDEQLFAVTKEGMGPFAPPGYESDMPAFKDILTDDEIRAIIAFIKSTWPEEVQRAHEKVNQAGHQH
jgi:mono/diheme cytochrome c family protein